MRIIQKLFSQVYKFLGIISQVRICYMYNMTMALGQRQWSRQRGYTRPTGREPRKGERKPEQSHAATQRPLRSMHLPNSQVQRPLSRKGRTMVAIEANIRESDTSRRTL